MTRLCLLDEIPCRGRIGAHRLTSRRKAQWSLVASALAGLALIYGNTARAADPPKLTAAKLKARAQEAIRSGAIQYKPAMNENDGHKIQVTMAFVAESMDADAQAPLVKIYYDQVEIELLRKDLLKRQSSRQIMEPYYAKWEEVLGKELAVAQDASLADEARDDQLAKLDEQARKALADGLNAVAKSIGLEGFEFLVGAAQDSHDVKLVASASATIDMVRQTTAALLHDVGKQDKDLPWTSYQGGDTASLSGIYYCRIRLNGREATSTKRVAPTTDQLAFPDP